MFTKQLNCVFGFLLLSDGEFCMQRGAYEEGEAGSGSNFPRGKKKLL